MRERDFKNLVKSVRQAGQIRRGRIKPSRVHTIEPADFPGCVTAGRTLEDAHRLAAEALRMHIKGMLEDGETIAEPSAVSFGIFVSAV